VYIPAAAYQSSDDGWQHSSTYEHSNGNSSYSTYSTPHDTIYRRTDKIVTLSRL